MYYRQIRSLLVHLSSRYILLDIFTPESLILENVKENLYTFYKVVPVFEKIDIQLALSFTRKPLSSEAHESSVTEGEARYCVLSISVRYHPIYFSDDLRRHDLITT